jgi:protein-L-isoaspartate O-methyltransferase
MTPSKDQLTSAKRLMIQQHLRGRGIDDQRILDAFKAVPRERFISPDQVDQAYADQPCWPALSHMSMPSNVSTCWPNRPAGGWTNSASPT